MAPNSPARRLKRWVIATLCVLSGVLVALSPSFGRAEPSGEYRPPVPPDALSTGCYPLPEGVEFDFSYQVRRDGDVDGPEGKRRNLVVQYNLIDRDDAARALASAFVRAGFEAVPGDEDVTLAKDEIRVSATVTPMDPLTEDQIVRGTIELDLPVVARQSDAPVCFDVTSTKRFPQDGDQ